MKTEKEIKENNGVLVDHEPQRLNKKCLICPNQITAGFYCSTHSQQIQEYQNDWKREQEWTTRIKTRGIINQHLKSHVTCEPTNCEGLKAMLSKEAISA